jgi:hypothetical protein
VAKQLGFVTVENTPGSENDSFVYQAEPDAELPQIEPFRPWLALIEKAEILTLELAVNYDGFRRLGYEHEEALERLRRKKAATWTAEGEGEALALLRQLGLLADERAAAGRARRSNTSKRRA